MSKKKDSWELVMEKWGGWSSAPGYLTTKSFAEFLDKNFKAPKKLKKTTKK